MHKYYLMDENGKCEIISLLDHIRFYSKDRGSITDDCDKIEALVQELKSV